MNAFFKLKTSTLSQIRADMELPHAYAFERVGCVFTRLATCDTDRPIILATRYRPLADDHYVRDESVGARIGSAAIQALMQEILDTRQGAFLVHLHGHRGMPSLSGTDRQAMLPLVPSLRNAEPEVAHGVLLLSEDHIAGWAVLPGQARLSKIAKIAVVGFPPSLFFNVT